MTNRTIRAAIGAAAAAAALAGCGSQPWEDTQLDEPGWTACDQLGAAITEAGGGTIAAGLPPGQRAPLVDAVRPAGTSGSGDMADAAGLLVAVSETEGPEWAGALTEIAGECTQLGY